MGSVFLCLSPISTSLNVFFSITLQCEVYQHRIMFNNTESCLTTPKHGRCFFLFNPPYRPAPPHPLPPPPYPSVRICGVGVDRPGRGFNLAVCIHGSILRDLLRLLLQLSSRKMETSRIQRRTRISTFITSKTITS